MKYALLSLKNNNPNYKYILAHIQGDYYMQLYYYYDSYEKKYIKRQSIRNVNLKKEFTEDWNVEYMTEHDLILEML
jgi:sulfur relay (sulfurtransferase) DsrF/TusC family protein